MRGNNPYSNAYNSGNKTCNNFLKNFQNLQSQLQPYHAPQSYPTQNVAPIVPMPYSAPSVPQQAKYQPPHWRNENNELRMKVNNLKQ